MKPAQVENAIGSLTTALTIRTKLLGPLDPSLVYDLDRMGSLQVSLRAYDEAEATYRHALVIRETLYGKVHADLIQTVDGLAYSLFGQKKYDEAEPLYLRLLDLWKFSVQTETHPMVAFALDKIAVFYATQKKWEQAREATTKANAIRAFVLADGLSNEASQRIDEGKLAEAIPIYQRALKVLDPPNPIYDEQRALIEAMDKEIEKTVKRPPTGAPPPSQKSKK
jgi:tetratricopeptide (TPR) repeat protein